MLIDEPKGYFAFSSRTALAYWSVAVFSSSLRWFWSPASAFRNASRSSCTLVSAALTSSMVDMAIRSRHNVAYETPRRERQSLYVWSHVRLRVRGCPEPAGAFPEAKSSHLDFAVFGVARANPERFAR